MQPTNCATPEITCFPWDAGFHKHFQMSIIRTGKVMQFIDPKYHSFFIDGGLNAVQYNIG